MPPSKNCTDRVRRLILWRMVAAKLRSDGGSASLEFITAGMILLLPMVYLILTMSQIQGGSFAVEGAARQAARVFVQSDDPDAASSAARRAVDFALDDAGLAAGTAIIDVTCSPKPLACLTRNSNVTVVVRLVVPLPLVPPALEVVSPLGVPLEASATQKVSRFWGTKR